MSSELAIGLSGIAVALVIGAVQIWQGRKRREGVSASRASNAQALREEAAAVLTDVAISIDDLEPMSVRSVEKARTSLEEHCRTLARLRSRLRVAGGITEPEMEAFVDAVGRAFGLRDAVTALYLRNFDDDIGPAASEEDFAAEITTFHRCHDDFFLTMRRFEEVAREAARG